MILKSFVGKFWSYSLIKFTNFTWDLRVPGESLGAVNNSRHWNFLIWSTNKGDMAILVEGYN